MQDPSTVSADGMPELVMALLRRTKIKESRHTLYATGLAQLNWHDILAAVRTSTLASVYRLSLADACELSHAVAQHCREFEVDRRARAVAERKEEGHETVARSPTMTGGPSFRSIRCIYDFRKMSSSEIDVRLYVILRCSGIADWEFTQFAGVCTKLRGLTGQQILDAVQGQMLADYGISPEDAQKLSAVVGEYCREFQRREGSVRVKRSRSPSPDQPKSKRMFPAAMNGPSTNERSVGDIRAHKRSRQALFGITQAIAFDCKLPLTPEFKREARGKSIALLLECYSDGFDFYGDLARIMRLVVDEYPYVLPPDLDTEQRAAYAADTPVGALCGAPDTPAESESECDTDEDESECSE